MIRDSKRRVNGGIDFTILGPKVSTFYGHKKKIYWGSPATGRGTALKRGSEPMYSNRIQGAETEGKPKLIERKNLVSTSTVITRSRLERY